MEFQPVPVRSFRRGAVPLTIALVIIGIAAVALTMGLGASGGGPAFVLAAGGASTTAPSAAGGPGANGGWVRGPGSPMGGPGGRGGSGMAGGRNGGGLGQVSITAINGSQVSLQSSTGWTRTIDVTGLTIQRAGATITVSDLKVGDHVALGEMRGSNGAFTLQSVTVVLDQASGTVSKIDASSITVTGVGGGGITITTSSATVYRRAGAAITRGDVAVGERLVASGTTAPDGSLAAAAVDVEPDVVFGTLTGKSGSTLTIKTAGGGTATVNVSPGTTYRVAGVTSPTLADVAVNDQVMAQGVLASDGSLTATAVQAGTGRGFGGGGGFGPGGRGFGGGGPWAGPNATPAPTAGSGTSG